MPKQTFHNLPLEKKSIIFNAAYKEFSNVSFYDASIANIIREACISRGSFYQYFSNKEDIYFYIVDQLKSQSKVYFENLVKSTKGNLWEIMESLFKHELSLVEDDKYRQFFKQFFLNLNIYLQEHLPKRVVMYEDTLEEFMEDIDLSGFKQKNQEYILYVINLITLVIGELMKNKLIYNVSNEEIMERYKLQVDIIKNGALNT
ncbi:TetR family transcriptional regulator [Natranaerovirga hydrolytica]|uniref:TetR family transcriptional regulator n=1 Tax=Natranaerovirga hydrolytica TaxID=680378 RepID=A0A4R1MJC2_9FIRM|nr:TetR family transcriptional regulator [Natranaerovirga hydrolytica]TCK92806.1 TetR family transcriptional regulator [Natranaerovirga hydrolytica]